MECVVRKWSGEMNEIGSIYLLLFFIFCYGDPRGRGMNIKGKKGL